MVTVTKNPDGSFTTHFGLEAQAVFDRLILEHTGRLSEVGLIDALFTNWLSQNRQRHENDDFANLSPRQRRAAIDAGKAGPR